MSNAKDKKSNTIKRQTPPVITEQYGLMLHGPGTDKFAQITLYKNSKEKGQQDKAGQQIIKDGDMTVFIQKYKQLTGNLGISTHKLLRVYPTIADDLWT